MSGHKPELIARALPNVRRWYEIPEDEERLESLKHPDSVRSACEVVDWDAVADGVTEHHGTGGGAPSLEVFVGLVDDLLIVMAYAGGAPERHFWAYSVGAAELVSQLSA